MSNHQPLVSIGIPAYKGASKLKIAIESAIAQDYANLEIVISDDASPDDTPSLCQEFCQRDNRIKYVRQPKNLGLTDNFQAVFKETRGDFFMWLSQDDWIEPTYVSQCTKFLLENPDYALVYGKTKYFLDENFLFEGEKINLDAELGTERILALYAKVLDNGALYSVMRRHQLEKWLIPKTMNGDWIQVASLVFQGKIKTLETAVINRQNRWHKNPLERAKEFVKGEGLPTFQATKPGISISISAFKDIAWLSPTYAPLGKLGRWVFAWDVFQVLCKRSKFNLNTSLLSVMQDVDGQYPDESALTEFRLIREKVADFWLIAATEQLPNAYAGNLGKLHQMLLSSGIKDEPLTDAEQIFVSDLAAQISKGFAATNAIQYFLAAMLYRYAHQLPLQYEGIPIPKWFFDNYLKYMLECPEYFQEIGEVDRYYRHLQQWVARLHANILKNPDSKLWQDAALFFTQNASFLPLYFTTENLNNIYSQRADIMEFALKSTDRQIDYVFPERAVFRKKIRLGILKINFNPQTETFATLPAFEYLDRNQFEIILYTLNVTNHPLEKYCSSRSDRLVKLPDNLAEQVQTIRADDLDILLIGNNVTANTSAIALLTLHRLARVQVTSMMSPVSTGRRHIDYYIAGELTAPIPESAEHYREQLLTIEGSGLCFSYPLPPDTPTVKPDRKNWGATDESIAFISGANFYKIIPEQRETWAKILAAVPNSVLVLYPFNPNWTASYSAKTPFLNRMQAVFAQYDIDQKRLVVLNRLPSAADIKEHLKLADIYLDSFPYSGATSLVDALEVGLPTVVLEGNALRCRQAAALLRELDVTDLITSSEEDYIRLAVKLANNPEMRRQKREHIQQQMANNPSFLDCRSYAMKIGAVFQEIFQKQQDSLIKHIDLDSDDRIEVTPTEPAIASAKFQNQLAGCVNLYQIDPSDESILAELRKLRKEIADFWLSAETEKLENFYLGNVGKSPKILLESGILNDPMTETERTFADELVAQIAKGFDRPQALNYLLAAMLYFSVSQLPLPGDRASIPQWVKLN